MEKKQQLGRSHNATPTHHRITYAMKFILQTTLSPAPLSSLVGGPPLRRLFAHKFGLISTVINAIRRQAWKETTILAFHTPRPPFWSAFFSKPPQFSTETAAAPAAVAGSRPETISGARKSAYITRNEASPRCCWCCCCSFQRHTCRIVCTCAALY